MIRLLKECRCEDCIWYEDCKELAEDCEYFDSAKEKEDYWLEMSYRKYERRND